MSGIKKTGYLDRFKRIFSNGPTDTQAFSTVIQLITRAHQKLDRLSKGTISIKENAEKIWQSGSQVDKGTQILLSLKYRELAEKNITLPFNEVEFRNFSQSGEDGILLYIFSLIGTANRTSVEICAGTGYESNSANLVINHGWRALLVDGDEKNIDKGLSFFKEHPDTSLSGPTFALEWIDRDSVNPILEKHGFTGEIDLLSLDLDGVDYWIWDAIEVISPRVVLVEYNLYVHDRAVTVPYDPAFVAKWHKLPPQDKLIEDDGKRSTSDLSEWLFYGGASLAAFIKLGKKKGYRLVGTNSIGFNAFFIRDDIGGELFPEVDRPIKKDVPSVVEERLAYITEQLANFEWEEV